MDSCFVVHVVSYILIIAETSFHPHQSVITNLLLEITISLIWLQPTAFTVFSFDQEYRFCQIMDNEIGPMSTLLFIGLWH